MGDVILLGASGLAREVIASHQTENRYIGILDDDQALHGGSVGGLPVLGPIETAHGLSTGFLVCIGSGAGRRAIVRRLALLGIGADRYSSHLDRRASVGRGCRIGAGSILLAGAVITADARVGAHVVLMPNTVITHDDVVGDYATLAAGAVLGGGVSLGEACYLGMNAAVHPGRSIGAEAVIGMGATVLGDVPAHDTWAGVPARPLRHSEQKTVRPLS